MIGKIIAFASPFSVKAVLSAMKSIFAKAFSHSHSPLIYIIAAIIPDFKRKIALL
jgi:hypothetical protein